ncbi:PWWP domain-containing DNA repair factor 3A isoform X2 [Tiliqua scincoides]|uniref:PWWP domain-containing DNA repair factor 3A isoform X2 n=1 Tax=Tiliqua scincoides TaxID=71010 RepID=UPI0034618FF7
MTEAEYILCKWRKRLWPAKVLPRSRTSRRQLVPSDKAASLQVEIICLNKQAIVRRADTEPLKKERIEDIASKLELKRNHKPVEELTYRRALLTALNILNCGSPAEEDSPSKGRRAKLATCKDTEEGQLTTLMASHEQLSTSENAQKRKRREKTSNAPQAALLTNKCNVSSRQNTEEASTCKPFGCNLRPHQSNGELDSQCPHSISKTKIQRTPPKDVQHKPLPKSSVGKKSPRSLKKNVRHQKRDESGGECRSPSPASLHLRRTSTPASHNCRPRLTQRSKKSTPKPGLRRVLVISPVKHASTNLADYSLGQEETPPKKYSKASDGSRCLGDSERTCRRQHRASLSASQERQCRCCPKALNCGPSLDGLVLEHKEKENQSSDNTFQNFQLQDLEDEGLESTSDLSLRLSPEKESSFSSAFRDEDEEEEEELPSIPSILLHQEPCSFEAGMLVWCKLRSYPYWPAVVKRVKQKAKKASVLFIEKNLDNKKLGFFISFKNLKHFDCEEKQMLIDKARENYCGEINWCIDLITDYRIRVGCHSFMGSLLEYCADDMSYPVRKEAHQNLFQMSFLKMEEEDFKESLLEVMPAKPAKKVLPDRMRPARDKANEKLVEFIVKAKGADKHLQAILKCEKQSQWLKEFLDPPPYLNCIETYLEDDGQQELVVNYLREVYQEVGTKKLRLRNGDSIRLILDVLFPEAIIYAISAVDHIDYKKAEEKYKRGPLVTQREREIFEEEILEKKRRRHLQCELPPPEGSS